jgi:phosphoglycolate phosphatase
VSSYQVSTQYCASTAQAVSLAEDWIRSGRCRRVIVIGADSVTRPKPAGDMIHAFADATGIPPRAIAMVGDNPHDIETARAGGAGLAIGVLSGNAAHEDIAHLADHTIASIVELPALLRRLS